MSWIVPVKDQYKLQIEMSNYCNAACPECARSKIKPNDTDEYSFSLNDTYISLEKFQSWVNKDQWSNLQQIHMCGNYDEATTNPDLVKIVEWILDNDTLFPKRPTISIATNGGTRSIEFWTKLGEISKQTDRLRITWGIDGFEDTNHLYRINVKWDILQRNYKAYISAGGTAIWQFIYFAHNEHQADDVMSFAKQEGFSDVKFIGSPRPNVKAKHKPDPKSQPQETYKQIVPKCHGRDNSSQGLYITHHGYIVPCCWWGTKNGFTSLWQNYSVDAGTNHKLTGHNSIQDVFNNSWYSNLYAKIKDGSFPKCIDNCMQNKIATHRFEKINDR